jgi:hypothetical protein
VNFTNLVLHICVKEERYESMIAIVEAYHYMFKNKASFTHWFFALNGNKMTALEIAAQKGNKDIIKYLYNQISDKSLLGIIGCRSNVFHSAAKNNQCYPIVILYLYPSYSFIKSYSLYMTI